MYHINKILLSLLLSICVTLSYSQEQHLATLIPAGGGHFPITNSQYLQGATKIAFDTTARNNIPSYYRDTTTFLCYTIVDSSLWILRNGIANSNYKKIATLSNIVGNVNTILNGGNTFGVPIVIGSNDNKNVGFIRNGSTYLSLGGGREYFGTSQNYWVDTVGNMFGQLWKGLNSYTSTSLNIPYDTLPPPTGVWDTGYISLLATNRSDNHLWLRSGHENGTHNTIWKQIPLSSDLNGYGNTFSQGVIPTSSVAAIPFYNGVHSISYTNNALMDSVTGAIYVNNKRLADTTQLLTVGSNITNASGTISINNSNVVAALGYMPYNASNPSNYIAKSALSATNNSSTSIFSYNSATGAYNLDTTKLGTVTGVTAGIDLTGGGTSGTVTVNADTTTGATKLATQGNVTRGLSTKQNTISLPAQNGSVLFSNSSGIGYDSLNLYYNNSTARLGIGSITSGNTLITPPMTGNALPFPFVASTNVTLTGGSAFNLCSNPTVNVLFNGSSPWWWQIDMGTVTTTNSYSITAVYGNQYAPSTFKLLGSNDGSSFDTLDSRISFSNFTSGSPYTFNYNKVASGSYRYYRLYITATNQYSPYLAAFGIYNGTTTHLIPMAKLGINTVTSIEIGEIIQGVTSQSADLQQWQNSSNTVLAKVDASGNIKAQGATIVGALLDSSTITSTSNIIGKAFNSTATVTDLTTGSNTITAGHIYFSMPFQGSVTNGGYKKVMIYLNGLSNTTTTITYSSSGGIAFTNTPYIYGTTGAVALVTATNTTVTIAAATTATGYIFLEGN